MSTRYLDVNYLSHWIIAISNRTQRNFSVVLGYVGDESVDSGFAQFFLKYNHYPGLICDAITQDTCDPPDSGPGQYDSSQQFYYTESLNLADSELMYSAIHQFFNQYYTAIGQAQPIALGKVGDIVLAVNPPKNTQVDGKLLSILILASFTFVCAKEFLGGIEVKVIFIGILALAGGSAQVGNYLYDQGDNTWNQFPVQIADVQSRLSDMTTAYQGEVAKLL
ncbi:hypothetical protein K440DRAFT_645691 [Wilcoxina mikolae CBS 423.85]|nr:hypothetical protein K440DRAFT_645691 [Wilcoxina mikolae CBS 423.85]